MTALAAPIWELAGASPRAIALEDQQRQVSFGDLEERTNAFGHGLEGLGVKPGDHVALVAGNRLEFVEALLGARVRYGAWICAPAASQLSDSSAS